MEKQTKKVPKEKTRSLSLIEEEVTQLTDLAQAVNARCFYLREEIRLIKEKNTKKS